LRNSVEEIDVGKVDEDKDTSSSAETAGDKYSNISKIGQRCLNKLIRSGYSVSPWARGMAATFSVQQAQLTNSPP